MARSTVYVCSQCGSMSAQWHGQCPACAAWNTLVEERARSGGEGRGARGARRRIASSETGAVVAAPVPLGELTVSETVRLKSGLYELDRVLGGGIVPGSLILLGGSPGIGKSTLTNMVLGHLAAAGQRTLYVSGEESPEQVRLRAERLDAGGGHAEPTGLAGGHAAGGHAVGGHAVGGRAAGGHAAGGHAAGGHAAGGHATGGHATGGHAAGGALSVPVLAETRLEAVLEVLERHAPEVCVIDSVQTLRCGDLSGAPGSVGQVREVAAQIMEVAKARQIAVILVGHVTKEGALAGPRVLEHLVDCVLQFEGESERPYRELRALKNRFGSTSEAALFEMRQGGLVEVLDASARFVAQATRAPGSVVLATMEGSRPLLVEVQALVSPSELEQPRRVVSGFDRNRLALVLAILARHGGIGCGAADVFVNVVGGVRVEEPGADLAIALAVASAARGVSLRGAPCVCFGELGLTGELRWVGHPERRLAEAARHGLSEALAPSGSGKGACEAATLREALSAALPSAASRSAVPPSAAPRSAAPRSAVPRSAVPRSAAPPCAAPPSAAPSSDALPSAASRSAVPPSAAPRSAALPSAAPRGSARTAA